MKNGTTVWPLCRLFKAARGNFRILQSVISFAAKIAKISRLRSNKTNLIGDEAV